MLLPGSHGDLQLPADFFPTILSSDGAKMRELKIEGSQTCKENIIGPQYG